MAGQNCGVTIALLGVLLLGAVRLLRGAGECGAAVAGGAEWCWWPAIRVPAKGAEEPRDDRCGEC